MMRTTSNNWVIRKIFFLGLFLQFTILPAQITISNNSFIYVKGTVLTSYGTIKLVSNSSKIYLREEAQLLQKGDINSNEGQGTISVYQDNNVHEYAYNFWCSPVGNTSNSSANNPFKVNQIHDPLLNTASTIDSQPALFTTGGQGVNSPLTIAKSWLNIFQAGNTLSNWLYVGDTGNIAPGLGFTMKGTINSNNNQTYDFRGKPNNGTVTNNVLESQWTLIGNPYPSALDALQFIHDPQNVAAITGTLYFWQQDLSVLSHNIQDYVGGYASYTISQDAAIETFIPAPFNTYNTNGEINTNGNPTVNATQQRVKRYLPIGQGFMVEGKIGTSGLVRAKNTHRAYYKESDPESAFFKSSQTPVNLPTEYSRFRLNIDFNNTYTRQLVQTFNDNATNGFDYGLESKRSNALANDACWIQQNIAYVSQASIFNENTILPLDVNLATNSTLRFRVIQRDNLNSNQPIYLYDASTELYYDLRTELPEISLLAGNYQNRFDIRFLPPTILNNNINNPSEADVLVLTYHKKNKEIILYNKENRYLKKMDLMDISGKLVFSVQINSDTNIIKTAVDGMAQGVYIAVVTSVSHVYKTKLIVY